MDKEKLAFIKANGKVFKLKVGELIRFETDTGHFYWLNDEYAPSVTGILGEAAPLPLGLKKFFQKNTEEEATQIFETAGDFGSKIHDALEKLLKGLELNLIDNYPTVKEKQSLTSFIDWFQKWKPTDIESEQTIASKKYHYAGTLDFVGKIDNETWLIDFKTSNAIHLTHKLQVLAYKQAYEESTGTKIDRVGVLRLGTLHKGNGKSDDLPMVGKGWELQVADEIVSKDEDGKKIKMPLTIEAFMNIYKTYLVLHGGKVGEPKEIAVYPETLKLLELIKEAE